MTAKKIQIKTKPTKNMTEDEWVNNRRGEKSMRLTVLMPECLFKLFKTDCAQNGHAMSHEVVTMLQTRYERK